MDESEVKNNESMIQSLDDFLKKSKINENPEQRELFEEERNKIEEYDRRRKEQDEQLDEKQKENTKKNNEIIDVDSQKVGNTINPLTFSQMVEKELQTNSQFSPYYGDGNNKNV